MAKSKNHTAHNQSYKAHKTGIKKVKATKYQSTKGVSVAADLLYLAPTSSGIYRILSLSLTTFCIAVMQMDPKFLRNQVRAALYCPPAYPKFGQLARVRIILS